MINKISALLLSVMFLIGCSADKPKLGVNASQLMPCPETPNCVCSQTSDKNFFIQPLPFYGTAEEARQRLINILKTWPRTKIVNVRDDYIRVEFTSKIFRFIDDAEFYFPSIETEKIIHVRSASRIGHSDLGVNRERMERLRNTFKANDKCTK